MPAEVTTPSETEITVKREFNAPVNLVWRAHTEADLVQQWMTGPPGMTMPVCEIDFKVPGGFRYVWRQPNGTEMGMGGVFKEIVTNERIVHTELYDEDWTAGETLVTTVFTEINNRTTVVFTVKYSSRAARDAALSTGMGDGMEASYQALDVLVRNWRAT